MIANIKGEIEIIVLALGELAKEVVFVGGCLPVFYVDQELFDEPRPTEDIDCIIEIATLGAHHVLENKLREKGFVNVPSMIARWSYKGIIIDIMPVSKTVLGFSNQWYNDAFKASQEQRLPKGSSCFILTPAYFLATKLEALKSRAQDLRLSKDLEDIFYVINGREEIVNDVVASPISVRKFIISEVGSIANRTDFNELLEANLSRTNRARISIMKERIDRIRST